MIRFCINPSFIAFFVLLVSSNGLIGNNLDDSVKAEFFEKKIRPILSQKCYECHSAAKKVKGGLRLDSKTRVTRGGDSGKLLVPGKPEMSLIIEAISYTNVDLQMPPKSRLKSSEIDLIKKWISDGAYFPEDRDIDDDASSEDDFNIEARFQSHWWHQSISETSIPDIQNSEYIRNPVDAFIQSKLKKSGLSPAPEASRQSLIRRIFFDTIGLPPSVTELDEWMSNDRDLSELVNQLLRSNHFGEKWAQHWLDLVRYAETLGHEFDYTLPNAWRYRDYLIRAFNQDLPYDQFLVEHIAGDRIKNPRRNPVDNTNESIKATAFYWLGQQVHSPVDLLGNQAEVTDNQIDVMTKSFLGLTVSCARCHDHKFDAISTRDYYSIYGSLTSSRYHQACIDDPSVRGPSISKIKKLKSEMDLRLRSTANEQSKMLSREVKILRDIVTKTQQSQESKDLYAWVFEDFESGSFDEKWDTEGDAFGLAPIKRSDLQKVIGEPVARGKFLVHSHISPGKDGLQRPTDQRKGKLTSKPIDLKHRYLHFLLGGGNHNNRTGVQILVNGKVVQQRTGFNSNPMRPVSLDLKDWLNQKIQIRVIDDHTGGWGNVSVDQFVFSDLPFHFTGNKNASIEIYSDLNKLAEQSNISFQRLTQLLQKFYQGKETSIDSMLGRFYLAVMQGDKVETQWANINSEIQLLAHDNQKLSEWILKEDAFDNSLVESGELVFDDGGFSLSELPGIHSGKLEPRLEGTASGETFVIEKPYLHVLCSGKDSRFNVVMENFNIIRGPIYGGIKKKANTTHPQWMTFDLSMWKGNDAYIQINDLRINDLAGPGSSTRSTGAIYAYIQSNSRSAPRVYQENPQGDFLSLSQESLQAYASNKNLKPQQAQWLNSLIKEGFLTWQTDNEFSDRLKTARKIADSMPAPNRVPAMLEGYGRDENVFVRGNPRNHGTIAERGYLEAFFPKQKIKTSVDRKKSQDLNGSGRLEFAQWMLEDENPLTARVYVNRVWYHLFGEGIVKSVDDMGLMGQEPSHPELLEWLSHWFVHEADWSTRKLIQLLMNSHTYRMSAQPVGEKWKTIDPLNNQLHSARIKRLPAELIRDNMLLVAGNLNASQFGGSIPIHLTKFMEGRGRPGRSGPLDGSGRRSLYVETRRNFLSPMLLAFDKPIPFTTAGKRTRSNVPAQALILMNDPFVKAQAGLFADRLLKEVGSNVTSQIELAYKLAFARKPHHDEIQAAKEFLKIQTTVQDGDTKKALIDFCHTLFNLKEFIFIQ